MTPPSPRRRVPPGARRDGAIALVAVLALLALAWLAPSRVLAACSRVVDPAEALEAAPIAFVGTVTELQNENRWATVRVEEVWRGGSLPQEVEVHGGAEPGTTSANDRLYGPLRYLFIVQSAGPFFTDHACSGTTAWSPEVEALRPPSVAPAVPVGGGAPALTFADVAPVVALAVLVVIVVVAYLAILRARKRPPDWVR